MTNGEGLLIFIPPLWLIRIALTPVDWISDIIAGFLGSPDLVKIEDRGYYVRKYYVYRKTKLKPDDVDKIFIKLMEALEPPLRNPSGIKVVEIKPLEEGLLTKDIMVVVDVPKYGLFTKMFRRNKLIEKAKEKV